MFLGEWGKTLSNQVYGEVHDINIGIILILLLPGLVLVLVC